MSQQKLIEEAYGQKDLLNQSEYAQAVESCIESIESGELRVARPAGDNWEVNEWAKKAILLYFGLKKMQTMPSGAFEYYDKIPLQKDFEKRQFRVVPGAVVRRGSHLAKGVVLMPSFINIGAYVGEGTMVDTWATVGSCAQIGAHVHLSGGVGIGGVLEPAQAAPVIIEDNAFLGSRAIVVEGVRVEKGAVLGAGVVLTMSTRIIDVNSGEEYKGRIPANSVVIPGTRTKEFKAGNFSIPCALVIGQRKESTDTKTSLNNALRDFGVSV